MGGECVDEYPGLAGVKEENVVNDKVDERERTTGKCGASYRFRYPAGDFTIISSALVARRTAKPHPLGTLRSSPSSDKAVATHGDMGAVLGTPGACEREKVCSSGARAPARRLGFAAARRTQPSRSSRHTHARRVCRLHERGAVVGIGLSSPPPLFPSPLGSSSPAPPILSMLRYFRLCSCSPSPRHSCR